jgi:hypothetical protein
MFHLIQTVGSKLHALSLNGQSFICRFVFRLLHHWHYPSAHTATRFYCYALLPHPAQACQPRCISSDYMEHDRSCSWLQSAPPSPMAHYLGSLNPLVSFLSDVQDWSVLDKSALVKALQELPVPMSGQFQCVQKMIYRIYRLLHRLLDCNNIIYYIVYDIVYDIVFYNVCFYHHYLRHLKLLTSVSDDELCISHCISAFSHENCMLNTLHCVTARAVGTCATPPPTHPLTINLYHFKGSVVH